MRGTQFRYQWGFYFLVSFGTLASTTVADPQPESQGPPAATAEIQAIRLLRATTDSDYYPSDPAKEELGKLLFFDKVLSGNENISYATCHHPLAGAGDALSLPIGEGGIDLGPTRNTGAGVPERVPRNAPHVFNLGAVEFETMFHDGRVQVDPLEPSGFRSPAGDSLPDGLDDFGRERVTGNESDRFRFRTPSLHNVQLTGPWGHDGAYDDLEMMVRHHLDPLTALSTYDTGQVVLTPDDTIDDDDFTCHGDPERRSAVASAIEITSVHLKESEIVDLIEFLRALTDPTSLDSRKHVPLEVPSGIAVAE